MIKNIRLATLAIATLAFTSCKKDTVETDNSQQFRTKIDYATITSSSNYFETFKDKEGNSTVDFSGQTTRQDMIAELDSVMKIATGSYAAKGVPAAPVEASQLSNMYANSGSPFRNDALNAAADKQLKGKTAGSFTAVDAETERSVFEFWLSRVATASNSFDKTAADGQAGIAVSNSGSKYLVDEFGIEYGQLIQKGLIGAVMMDQMLNVYFGSEKLSLDNSKTAEGKNYTAREHSWDEAYGYLTKNPVYPMQNPADQTKYLERYLGNYVRPVGDASQLFLSFLKGRAAVVNNDEATMNQQVEHIRGHVETAIASFAISYLNKTKSSLAADAAAAMHAFGEGAGFVYSLRFAPSKKINTAKSNELLNKLIGGERGFYSLTPTIIDEVRNEIATAYGLDASAVVSH